MTIKYPNDDDGRNSILQSTNRSRLPHIDLGRSNHKVIHRLLKGLISRLNRSYTIEKASLAIYDQENNNLRVTHMLTKGTLKSGLTLTIPNQTSLLYQVLLQGYPVVDNYPELISANIIEQKILLGRRTQSVIVIPLIYDCHKLGVLSLASPDESAFGLYLDGVGEDMVAEFVGSLGQMPQQVEHSV